MKGRVPDRKKYMELRKRAYADAKGLWKILEGKLRRRQPRWLWGVCVCVMTVGLIVVDAVKWARGSVGAIKGDMSNGKD